MLHSTVRKLAKRSGREPGDLWVRFPPVLLASAMTSRGPAARLLSYKEETGVRLPPGRLARSHEMRVTRERDLPIHPSVRRCFAAACLLGTEVVRVRLPGGPFPCGSLSEGRLVQREDAWLAPRRSGFNS